MFTKSLTVVLMAGLVMARSPPHGGHSSYGGSGHAHSGSSGDDAHADIVSLKSDVRHDGFDTAVETSNHIVEHRSGDEHGNIHGDFSWLSSDGVPVHFSYVADENGYQPSSDLLPTPPPIPEAILKALEYIRTHPSKENYDGGHTSGGHVSPSSTGHGHGRGHGRSG